MRTKETKSKKCNHDCFNCKYDDCVNDVLTKVEKMEANQRDRSFTDYGTIVLKARPQRAKLRGAMH